MCLTKNYFPKNYFPKNYFPKNYFPKNYLPKNYFPKNYLPKITFPKITFPKITPPPFNSLHHPGRPNSLPGNELCDIDSLREIRYIQLMITGTQICIDVDTPLKINDLQTARVG